MLLLNRRLMRHPRRRTGCCLYASSLTLLLLFCTLLLFHSRLGTGSTAISALPRTARNAHGVSQKVSPLHLENEEETNLGTATLVTGTGTGSENEKEAEGEDDDDDAAAAAAADDDDDDDDDDDVEVEEDLESIATADMEGGNEEEVEDVNWEGLEISVLENTTDLKGGRNNDPSLDSSTHINMSNMSNRVPPVIIVKDKRALTEHHDLPQAEAKVKRSLQKLGVIKTLPRWDPLEDLEVRSKPGYVEQHKGPHSMERSFDKNGGFSSGWSGITWDHLLGVVRKTGFVRGSLVQFDSRKVKFGKHHSTHDEVGVMNSSFSDSIQVFSSDDEPLDQNVRDKLDAFTSIEDALLLKIDKVKNGVMRLLADKKPNKGDAYKKERSNKGFFDPLNPANNPLLQDPDTSAPSGLNGNDKAMLKAFNRASMKVFIHGFGKIDSKPSNSESALLQKISQDAHATERNRALSSKTSENSGGQLGNAAERSILELSTSDFFPVTKQEVLGTRTSRKSSPSSEVKQYSSEPKFYGDTRRWGFYPGLDPDLAFSEFMDQFLHDRRCSHRVFMAWTTPPWTYTIRYQRGLESLLFFHPEACVVVFSESIELNFFMDFVKEGFRVAVVLPNLEELLDGTPADDFASFWLSWRKTQFFYIHYTELLRLAALYKYGGIYLDTDVVLLKPLDSLHNTIGADKIENRTFRLNGAVMAFDKFSSFLLECLVEFQATYDDQLMDFNGAGLVTRVANRIAEGQNTNISQYIRELRIEEPYAFFPVSSVNITRYFKAAKTKQQQIETDGLLEKIYKESHTLHFWNRKTERLVPEVGSLVERIINSHCIKCHEYL